MPEGSTVAASANSFAEVGVRAQRGHQGPVGGLDHLGRHELVEQLADGGRMILPIGSLEEQTLTLVPKIFAMIAVAVASLFEIIPTFLIKSNVPTRSSKVSPISAIQNANFRAGFHKLAVTEPGAYLQTPCCT